MSEHARDKLVLEERERESSAEQTNHHHANKGLLRVPHAALQSEFIHVMHVWVQWKQLLLIVREENNPKRSRQDKYREKGIGDPQRSNSRGSAGAINVANTV